MANGNWEDNDFEALLGGPLCLWQLVTHVEIVRGVCNALYSWKHESCAILAEPELVTDVFGQDIEGQKLNDEAYSLAFKDMACSLAAVGAIAPLIETLVRKIAMRLREYFKSGQLIVQKKHERYKFIKQGEFWDPSVCWQNGKRGGFVKGFRQLLETLGLSNKLDPKTWNLLEIFFAYRGKIVHCGYEWPLGSNFEKRVTEELGEDYWEAWFDPWTDKDKQIVMLPVKQMMLEDLIQRAVDQKEKANEAQRQGEIVDPKYQRHRVLEKIAEAFREFAEGPKQ